ncbi:MAG: gliding motility-associated C-terminal domain-containing protein [Saprospiraceae bacterium]|nr:MAG: Hyalin repeat-containing protein [Bacteroidetes bacterium OLB9]MCO6463752.1 gliding motility-associated C-terminal domain-containing protein [Saprospiraceae bacterium]
MKSLIQRTIVVVLVLFNLSVQAQDTIPPILIASARDTAFECGKTSQLTEKLTDWFNNAGGAIFQDNSGSYTIQTNITLAQAIDIFNQSKDSLCGNTQQVQVIFTAVDADNNISLPDTAVFYTKDITPPTVRSVPNVAYTCQEGIRDTLIQWIKNKAGYEATDDCSDSVQWTIFTYGIFVGNTQVMAGNGNINTGPYPEIPDGLCNWTLRINFFVKDQCGNQLITPGTTQFSVLDNVAPVFIGFPDDVTVSCDKIPPATPPTVLDYCTRNILPQLEETSTQNADPQSCGHYVYTITRKWTATDNCGNSAEAVQVIEVRDKEAPAIAGMPVDSVQCHVFDSHPDSLFVQFVDACSPVVTTFSDRQLSSGCDEVIERTYVSKDVCANETTYVQVLKILHDTAPIITQPAKNSAFACTDQPDLDAELFLWVNDMGGSRAEGMCDTLRSFAALKGSYDINDPTTFPGTFPTHVPAGICPSTLKGWLRYVEVDFVYYDDCGNFAVTSAVFGIEDNQLPVVSQCPQDITKEVATGCSAFVRIPVPTAMDNCLEPSSTVVRKIVTTVTSQSPPGPESIIDPVKVRVGPFSPFTAAPLTDGELQVKLVNMDIDDATEYFNIYDEDSTFVGRSPLGPEQCSSVSFTIPLNKDRLTSWIQDGFIDLYFIPNVVSTEPVLAINNICGSSTVQTTITYETDLSNALRVFYQLNGKEEVAISTVDTLDLELPVGESEVRFIFRDCGGNMSSCTTRVTIKDKIAPVINCPGDISSVLADGVCKDTIRLPLDFVVDENCTGNRLYQQTAPSSAEAAQISFKFNDQEGRYEARSKQLVFPNVFPIRFMSQPVLLEVEFFGDNNDLGESFEILGPGGYSIGHTDLFAGEGCTGSSITKFELPKALFNSWISANQLTLLAVPVNGGDGINPCKELTAGMTVDNQSLIRARLVYSDARFSYAVTGATEQTQTVLPDDATTHDFILNGGKSLVTIYTADNAGNPASCKFEVNVIDQQLPEVLCKNATITIPPSGLETTTLLPEWVDNGSSDNCGSVTLRVEPFVFDCSMLNSDVTVQLIATDQQGNENTCTTTVRVKPIELQPSFSAGLCSNDTLKLFANVPPSSVPGTYTFRWQGPGGIEFFTENPKIPNVDESFNGTYILTITGFNGCSAVGSVIVNIKPLTNPELTANGSEICAGNEVILSTTNYSGDVTYDWYEGIFPQGVLLNTTTIPELILSPPTSGPHFYYVIARGPDCSSNPSSLLKVTVKEVPVAAVRDLFLSPCEGGDIELASSTFNAQYEYVWTGPRGFMAMGAHPPVIERITPSHAGEYLLVVKNGSCVSDTAVTRVTIFESPATPIITGLGIFCEGDVFTLVATASPGSEKYEWYKDGQLFTVTQDNSLIIPNAQTSLQGDWTVISVKGNCKSKVSEKKVVAIDASLQIGVINSGPVCMGDSVQLQATFVPNATYEWSGPVSNIPSIYNPIVSGVAGDYAVTITTPTSCKSSASTTVSIIQVPEITALSSTALPCMKKTDTLTFKPSVFPNALDYVYQWTGPNGFTSGDKSPVLTNLSLQDTGVYTLVILNRNCPSEAVDVRVNFNIITDQPVITAAPFYCEGDTIQISSNSSIPGASYEWTTPMGTVFTTTDTLFIAAARAANAGDYSLKIISGNCASDPSIPVKISVRKRPEAPIITPILPICYDSDLTIQCTSLPDAVYQWTGPMDTLTTTPAWMILHAQTQMSGLYAVAAVVDGCSSALSAPVEVIVKDKIATPIFTSDVINSCSAGSGTVEICLESSTLTPGAVYEYTLLPDHEVAGVSSGVCHTFNNQGIFNAGANFITVRAEVYGCFSDYATSSILNINTPPEIKAQAVEKNIITCPDETVRLISKHGPPLVDVHWTALRPENRISDPKVVSPVISGLIPGLNTIYLDYSVPGCPNFSSDTIFIYSEFKPLPQPDEYTLLFGQSATLDITENDVLPDNYSLTIAALPASGTVKIIDKKVEFIPDIKSLSDLTFKYKVCADFCDQLCTEETVVIHIDDNIDCFAPTIFTPNQDGINDIFIIPCLETGRYPDSKVSIFNEWGNEVFYANPYKNDWDGTYNGNLLPVGTYYYIIEVQKGAKPIKGFLILQR